MAVPEACSGCSSPTTSSVKGEMQGPSAALSAASLLLGVVPLHGSSQTSNLLFA